MTKVEATEALKMMKKERINEIRSEITKLIFSCAKKSLKFVK